MEKNKYPMGLMMPDDLAKKVAEAAKAMGVSKSGFVRYVLIKEFAKNENRFSRLEAGEPSEISVRFIDQDS